MVNCPICHRLTSQTQQAYLDNCFHCFCFNCIKEWSETRKESQELTCPLCRKPYNSVFYHCILNSYSRHWFRNHGRGQQKEDAFPLTQSHIKRRAAYFSVDKSLCIYITQPVFSSLKCRTVSDAEAQKWICRELQSLLLISDVEFLVNLVTHISSQHGECSHDILTQSLHPFLKENSIQFIEELQSFLRSGLNMDGYDEYIMSKSKSRVSA